MPDISGTITDPDNTGVPTITVYLSDTAPGGGPDVTTPTDGNGYFEFKNVAKGTYKITPASDTLSFEPSSMKRTVASSDIKGANFEAIPPDRAALTKANVDDLEYTRDVLAACLGLLNSWYQTQLAKANNDAATAKADTRTYVQATVNSFLSYSPTTPLDVWMPTIPAEWEEEKVEDWHIQQCKRLDEHVDKHRRKRGEQEDPCGHLKPLVLCSVCQSNYYLNHNYAELVQCMDDPPCTN